MSSYQLTCSSPAKIARQFVPLIIILFAIAGASGKVGFAQPSNPAAIQGTVVDAAHNPVAGASVRLEQKDHPGALETKTNPSGAFVFSTLRAGTYQLSSEKSGLRSRAMEALALSEGEQKHVDLVLEAAQANHANSSASASPGAIEFTDQPNFTVAGVTDWTAAGGHGSDSALRTGEDLAREALVLKPTSSSHNASDSVGGSGAVNESGSQLRAALAREPNSFAANHRMGEFCLHDTHYADAIPPLQAAYRIDPADRGNQYDLALAYQGAGDFAQARDLALKMLAQEDSAELHSLLGDLDESLGDPLTAVSEDEKAVRLDPSEQNYFQWGSELLLHRAVQPAVEVFGNGVKAHPKSARMLAALGASLFASGQYDEAAQRVCDASDLNPADPAPYIFLGKIEMAAPLPLACVELKLERFAQQQPGNAFASYYYGMAIWKRQTSSGNSPELQPVETLLTRAVTIDPNFDDAWLQLGILSSGAGDYEKAIGFYAKAIAINPQSSAAHYRLGLAYKRIGDPAKAKPELLLYDELAKQQAAETERQRREIKQFLVILKVQPASTNN
jgi:tetratricopeptide (TPR) repeat protein